MKKKEFANIGHQLLSDLPGFAVKGGLIFMQPIGHTLRGILFDQSIDQRHFYVHIFIQPLFVPSSHFTLDFGWRLGGGCHTWDADSPTLCAELIAGLKPKSLTFLSSIHSVRDVADTVTLLNKPENAFTHQAIGYALAYQGEVEPAVHALDKFIAIQRTDVAWGRESVERAQALRSQVLRDLTAAQKQLKAWEAETTRKLGFETLVSKPTPRQAGTDACSAR